MSTTTIYPNPFISRISLEVSSVSDENTIVSLLNQDEKILKMFSWHIKAGTNKTSLDGLANLPAGVYHVVIKDVSGDIRSDTTIYKD